MPSFVIAWNEKKTEGVIFAVTDGCGDEAMDDAYHAAGGEYNNPCSVIADNFRDTYGEEQRCSIQRIQIDNSKTIAVDK